MPRKKIEAVSMDLINQLDIPTMQALNLQLKSIDPELLGKRLRRIRVEKRLSQRDICKDLFTSAYLSSIELGKTRPTLQTLLSLAQRLGEPIEYFLLPAVGSFQIGKLRETLGEEQLDFLQIEFHLFQAEIALELGNLPMAQQELEPVKEVISSLNKNIQSQYFLLFSRLLRKQGLIDQALTELEKGYSLEETPGLIALAKNRKDLAGQYELEMGRIYRLKGNYVQALAHFEKGLNPGLSAERQKDGAGVLQPWQGDLLLEAGETSQLLDEPEHALSYFEQRNSLFDNGSFTGLSETLMKQAQASFGEGDFLKGAYLLGQSLHVARWINEVTDRLEVSHQISQLNLQLENLTSSKKAALDVESLVRLVKPVTIAGTGVSNYEFSSKLILAQISLQKGNVSLAQSYLDQANLLFENKNVELGTFEKAQYFQLAGRVFAIRGENDQANRAFERAIQILELVDSGNSTEPGSVDSTKSLLGELYFGYSQLLKKAGKLNESMDYIEKAYRLKTW